MNRKLRDSRFESLRIIAMIMIVSCHFSGYGNWNHNINMSAFKNFFFQPWGQVGVYLFIMISGYFLGGRKYNVAQSINRVKPLWIKTIFYSYFILLFYLFMRIDSLNIKKIILLLFPIFTMRYWFMTCFIILMLLLPVINGMIRNVDKKELIFYIILFTAVSDIIPLLSASFESMGSLWSVASLTTPFLISAFLKKYDIKIGKLKSMCIFLVGIIFQYILMGLICISGNLSNSSNSFESRIGRLFSIGPWHFNAGIFPLITATGIFLFVLNLRTFYNKLINYLASSVLAAYLITTHPLMINWFNKRFVNIGQYQNSGFLLLIEIGLSIVTVVCCCLIDKIYIFLIRKIENNIVR